MTRHWGYVLALLVGIFLGWLGQQFWSPSTLVAEDRQTERMLRALQSRDSSSERESGPSFDGLSFEGLGNDAREGEVVDERIKADDTFDRELQKLKTRLSVLRNQEQYDAFVSLLYDTRLSVPFEWEERYLAFVYDQVEDLESRLAQMQAWSDLVAVFRMLVSVHPDRIPYSLSLARWLVESGAYDEAREALSIGINELNYPQWLENLEGRISAREQLYAEAIAVPLQKRGRHYVVESWVNSLYPANLLLDTGATLTVIKQGRAEELGLIRLPSEPLVMTTANGKVEGLKVVAESLLLNDVRVENVELAIMPLPDFKGDGLLGMNVLDQFRFFIDQEQSRLLLKANGVSP